MIEKIRMTIKITIRTARMRMIILTTSWMKIKMTIFYLGYVRNWPSIKKTQYNFNTIQDEFKFLQYNTIQFLEKTNFNNSIQYEPLCIVFQYNSPCIGQPWKFPGLKIFFYGNWFRTQYAAEHN